MLAGVSAEEIEEARLAQNKNGAGFFELLLRKRAIVENDLLKILSHFGLLLLNELPVENMDMEFTQKVSIQYLKKYKMVPLITSSQALIVVNDPTNFQAVDDLRNLLQRPDAQVVLAPQDAIAAAINMAFDMSRSSAKDYFEEMKEASADELISEIDETADLLDEVNDSPIIKLVNLLVSGRLRTARDIHVDAVFRVLIATAHRFLYDIECRPVSSLLFPVSRSWHAIAEALPRDGLSILPTA